MKWHIHFCRKKKNISNCCLLNFLPSLQRVQVLITSEIDECDFLYFSEKLRFGISYESSDDDLVFYIPFNII